MTTQFPHSSSLDEVISSSRYTVHEQVGSGCWGKVYRARDNVLDEDVAIKIMSPSEVAQRQMVERSLNLFDAVKKEAGKLTAVAHVVPRRFEFDEQGKPFIVMPLYRRFLSDHVADNNKTGIYISTVIDYARDIARGISELHENFGIAHCDIKPNNIAIDKRGKLLLTDLGTSTYATLNGNSRDNMGCVYTRSPRLFVKGSHPEMSSDVFSFGSLLYKMFTGKYALEDEIDDAVENNNLEGLMDDLVKKFEHFSGSCFSDKYKAIVDKKVENVPEEFQDFLRHCLFEHYDHGQQILQALEKSIKSYERNNIRRNILSEVKAKALKAFAVGAIAAAAIVGFKWTNMITPEPNYNEAAGFHREINLRDFDKTEEVKFEAEKEYKAEPMTLGNGHYPISTTFSYPSDRTVLDKLVKSWIDTAQRTKLDFNSRPLEFEYRDRKSHTSMGTPLTDNVMGYMFKNYCCMLKSGNAVDLEDVGTALLTGFKRFRQAQKAANSMDFSDYSAAKDSEAKYIIRPYERKFIEQWCAEVQRVMPEHVLTK